MSPPHLSNELRRFIYSITSIPHLEAILLLHQNPTQAWDAAAIAQRLYVTEVVAGAMLADLARAAICIAVHGQTGGYVYGPATPGLHGQIAALADYYANHLIEVTNMIHAKASVGRVQQFADAFKFNRDK